MLDTLFFTIRNPMAMNISVQNYLYDFTSYLTRFLEVE